MKKVFKRLHYFPVLALLLVLSACATNKNNAFYRGWHNMNARYNGYFYSRENFKESAKKVEKANKDNFLEILPIFVYPDNNTAKNYYSDFDKTIKKSSVVIQRHAITTKKTKEEIPNACRWIDENYVLIGKAHFYKRDFFSALEAFTYVSKKYPKPEAKYSGMLWMIRTNDEIGSYSEAMPIIDQLRTAGDFPKDRSFQQDFAAVQADYYIKTADYDPAIKHLTKAISLTKNKKVKARFTFVLAQLYEKQGDTKKASMYYGMVPKLHPLSYDMEFNAKINQAKLYDVGSGDMAGIKKRLYKMLRDDKNIEYQDQIYYTLADIAYREKDIPAALTLLDKSIHSSVNNNTQKALSYMKRADIYFERTDYRPAEANYDSTMSFLPKEYPGYAQISEKKKSLTSLVTNLKTITLEDSLQRLAAMSEADRNKTIDHMIAKIEEDERKAEEAKAAQQEVMQLGQASGSSTTSSSGGSNTGQWYFYNPSTVSFGVSDFNKKWGARKLEDNWRRSQKDQVLAAATEDEPAAVDTTASKGKKDPKGNKTNKKDRDYYLKSVPLTPDALAKSNDRIVEAYYNVGSIYKEQLDNNAKSVEALEELLRRYPENKYKLPSYYQLYRTYLAMKNQPKSDYYRNIILKSYPDSEYAHIINNPDAAKDIAASRNVVEKFYSETYQLYSEGNYTQALANCLRADTTYAKSYLMPQFSFLKALCIGRTQDIDAFETALVQVTIKYPKDPVKPKAQEIIDQIKRQKNPAAAAAMPKDTVAKPKFIFNETGEYYWVTIVENGKGDINKFKTRLSDLNTQSFDLLQLNVSSVFLDMTHQLISVKTFDGKVKAMQYYNFMKDNKDAVKDLQPGTYQSFIISAENYPIFYKDKNVQDYQAFFTQNFK